MPLLHPGRRTKRLRQSRRQAIGAPGALLAGFLLLFADVAVAWPPAPVELRFELQAAGVTVGETVWRIKQPDDATLVLDSVTEPVAPYAWIRPDVVREQSTLQRHGKGLRTLDYRYARTGGKRDRFVAVSIDWDRGIASGEAKGQRSKLTVADPTLDKLGYLLAVARDAASGPRELDYPVATGDEIEIYRLAVGATEQLSTDTGPVAAVRVERLGQTRRHTVLWLAPALGYLPIRIEHTEKDGGSVTLSLVGHAPL